MNKDIVLSEFEIEELQGLADEARKSFGIYGDVPIANDLFALLEQKGIVICQYPFSTTKKSHTDASITRFELDGRSLVFIGLNTSIYYDEQIFALAHELYHYITKTGKAYNSEVEYEDQLTETKADRFGAELLLPGNVLHSIVVKQFRTTDLRAVTELRMLRFIARLQNEWWLPYRSLVLRLHEEGYIDKSCADRLFEINDRDKSSIYGKIFCSLAPDCYEKLNTETRRTDISAFVLEIFIQNYEDGSMTDDEFTELLKLFDKEPADFGFDFNVDENDLDELQELFEDGGTDES